MSQHVNDDLLRSFVDADVGEARQLFSPFTPLDDDPGPGSGDRE